MPITDSDLAVPRTHRRRLGRWIKRGLLAAIAIAGVGAIVIAWLPDPVPVDVASVQRGMLETEIAEDGRTRVHDRYIVSAPISGDLVRVELDPGAIVSAGETLAVLVPPSPQLLDARTRNEATARLAATIARERTAATTAARARAARDSAVRDAERSKQLFASAAIPAVEYERAVLAAELAERDVGSADAQRSAAAAETAAARAVLAPSSNERDMAVNITAPASGRVLRVLRDSAGPIAAGAPLLELGDPAKLEVVIDVLSSDAARIEPLMAVEIDRWGGDGVLHARVTRIEPSAFTRISALGVEEQRVRVIAALDAPPAALGDGFGVAARIITWRGEVVTLPASAAFRDHGRWAVFVVERGHARLVPITVGHRGRLDLEVTDMAPGTQIILHPGDSVHDGGRVAPR